MFEKREGVVNSICQTGKAAAKALPYTGTLTVTAASHTEYAGQLYSSCAFDNYQWATMTSGEVRHISSCFATIF